MNINDSRGLSKKPTCLRGRVAEALRRDREDELLNLNKYNYHTVSKQSIEYLISLLTTQLNK